MRFRHLRPADFSVMQWQNGRGTTTELFRENDATGDLLWRLSRADVTESGPFSALPGIDRILMLLEGVGFDLDFGTHGYVKVTEPLVPVVFSGDWPTRAENVRGPSRDLNLMLARGRAAAEISVIRGAGAAPMADRSVFLALDTSVRISAGPTERALGAGDLLIVSGAAGAVATVTGPGALVRVDIAIAASALS